MENARIAITSLLQLKVVNTIRKMDRISRVLNYILPVREAAPTQAPIKQLLPGGPR
jgi:hypothetical protein